MMKELEFLSALVNKLEVKVINLEFQLARMRAYIPDMPRGGIRVEAIIRDEPTEIHKGIVDRDRELTPTEEVRLAHQCQCSECDPL